MKRALLTASAEATPSDCAQCGKTMLFGIIFVVKIGEEKLRVCSMKCEDELKKAKEAESKSLARPFKFRTPSRCQNGHLRFLFYSINFGHCEPSIWERQPCECPTGEIGEGFSKAGPEQQWTGLVDSQGRDLYEGDIAEHSKYHDIYTVEWSFEAAGFIVRSKTHSCALSALCQQYLKIVGNVSEGERVAR